MASTFWKTPQGLVNGFYGSFADEETFTGTSETIEWARAIIGSGDSMWNFPYAVEDAEKYIAENA